MLFTTPTQYAVLALLLIAGWLFGLASHPGGKKWRVRYEAEREAHAAYRAEAETRIEKLERERVAVPAAARPDDAPARGPWLGARATDDLTRIRGIDATLEDRLRVAGIRTFADVEAIPPNADTSLEREVGVPDGTIAEQRWRELARMLREGREEA